MKILIVGSGGRESALAWRLHRGGNEIVCSPGNPGIAKFAKCIVPSRDDYNCYLAIAIGERVDLTVCGPEKYLVGGMADSFSAVRMPVVGPSGAAARAEGSKVWFRRFCQRHLISSPMSWIPNDAADAVAIIKKNWCDGPLVIKADGLAAGKGVLIPQSEEEAENLVQQMMAGQIVGDAGRAVVLEHRLDGRECSFIYLTDGTTLIPLPLAQDHKRLLDRDRGPNTGGMGSFSPVEWVSGEDRRLMMENARRIVSGMAEEGHPFKGLLYLGAMITPHGPAVLEANVRFGDPETQVQLPRVMGDLGAALLATTNGTLANCELYESDQAAVCVVLASEGYPGKPVTGREIRGLNEIESYGAWVFHAGTAEKDGQIVTAGGRVLGVGRRGDDVGSASFQTYTAIEISGLGFDGMQYRRDIGRDPSK